MGPATYCRGSDRWGRARKGVVAVDSSPKKWVGLTVTKRTQNNTQMRQKKGEMCIIYLEGIDYTLEGHFKSIPTSNSFENVFFPTGSNYKRALKAVITM